MSAPASPELEQLAEGVAREPARSRAVLALGLLVGPVAALANQEAIYAATMWACGHGVRAVLNVIPLVCLAITIAIGAAAWREWRRVGSGLEDEREGVPARARFLALLGVTISLFSALVIIAQWAAILVFAPCARA